MSPVFRCDEIALLVDCKCWSFLIIDYFELAMFAAPEGRPGVSDVSLHPTPLRSLSGISGLSFDSTLLSALLFCCLSPLLFLSCLFCFSFFHTDPFSRLFFFFRNSWKFCVWCLCACLLCINLCRDWFCRFKRFCGLMTCVRSSWETDWSLFLALI